MRSIYRRLDKIEKQLNKIDTLVSMMATYIFCFMTVFISAR